VSIGVVLNGRRDANDITLCGTTRMASRGRIARVSLLSPTLLVPLSFSLSTFPATMKSGEPGLSRGESHPCAPARTAPEPGGSIQSSCSLFWHPLCAVQLPLATYAESIAMNKSNPKSEISHSFISERFLIIIEKFHILIRLSFKL